MSTDQSTMRVGGPATAADIIDRVLDKGLVINADIAVSLAGVELLSIRIRAVLASLEPVVRLGVRKDQGTGGGLLGFPNACGAPPPWWIEGYGRCHMNDQAEEPGKNSWGR
jgi:hypothetical protein